MHLPLRAGLLLLTLAPALMWPSGARAELRFRALPDSTSLLFPLDAAPTVGLPPGWHFRLPTSGATGYGEPTVSVTFDPDAGLVRETYRELDVEIREPLVMGGADYSRVVAARAARRIWRDKTKQTRSMSRTGGKSAGRFRVELPVQLPKAVRSILGDGAPNLEVSGSETITLSGISDWTVRKSNQDTERRKQSAFPSFEMKQELNVNLTGSIGDKIKVDVDQSSNVQTSIDNKVKLRYEGDEDDMIKSVDLGNTNLSLSGASLRQDGLFGVKTVAKLGNVDITTIASKQEGKSETARFTPSGERTRVFVRDQDYIKRQYYFLADHPLVVLKDATLPPTAGFGSIEVWKDDQNGLNNGTGTSSGPSLEGRPGYGRLDPTADSSATNPQLSLGFFKKLTPGEDYVLLDDLWILGNSGLKIPVIRLTVPLQPLEVLGVSYVEQTSTGPRTVGTPVASLGQGDTLLVKVIKPSSGDLPPAPPDGDYDTSAPWYPTIPYELRNIYDLGARNIDYASLSLTVRRRDAAQVTDPDKNPDSGEPYIRVLGLDQRDELGNTGPDGKIDGNFIDEERGTILFPDVNPFYPAGFPNDSCAAPSSGFNCLNNTQRNTLRMTPTELANPLIYVRKSPDAAVDSRFYIDAEFKSSRQGYFLGRFDILEGSDQVKVDNEAWQRGRDYIIDYDTGQITFTGRTPGPEQVITVDYSFAPGVGQVQRTLLGVSTSYSPASNLSVSSSVLYESRGAQEQNPKLGEEPATSMLGDLSTVLSFKPVWMTDLANHVPGVRTSVASALNIQGSISGSVPNPNTKGEAYVDDMEGNRESNTVSLNRAVWNWSGVPASVPLVSDLVVDHARLEWYNARSVKEWYLKPVLTQEEGGDNDRQVLEMNVKPPTGETTVSPEDWTGITQSLSTVGQDLTKIQFMEIWVNDFTPNHLATQGTLKINFGRVTEDAYWDPSNKPNGLLDTEDKSHDGRLDGGDNLEFAEDTGLDGLFDKQEPGYDANTNPDPNGDDYAYTYGTDDYSHINNFENNGNDDPNARPDTEDLNRNGAFDRENAYFEASIDLSDTHYVAIDVPQLYAGKEHVKADNGWRLFRIPISDSTFTRVGGFATWDNVQAMRVWVTDATAPFKIQIGGIELVGSRWLRQPILDEDLKTRGVNLEVRARNNKDDAGIYFPPYAVENQVGGSAERREQSLALGYENVADGDTILAFKTYGDAGTNLGWAQYGQARFYVHGDLGVESQNLRVVARFGPDTLNYYEYSAPVRSGWQGLIVPLERLSSLKEGRGSERAKIDSLTAFETGEVYAVFGNPSFTRVNRVSFGVTVSGSGLPATGELWVDELRLADVRKEKGVSSNVSVQANFADLLTLNVSYQKQDQDFFRVGQGTNQGSGFDHTAVGFSTTLQADRFVPTSGVQLPIRLSVQRSTDVPKFRTNSDVILDQARSDLETRELNRQSIDMRYSRNGPRGGITRYTIDAITASMAYSKSGSVNPQSTDSSWAFSSIVGYTLPLGGGGFNLGKKMKISFLPEVVSFTSEWNSSRNVAYARTLSDTADVYELRSDAKRRELRLGTNATIVPLSSVRLLYNLSSTRDMLLHQDDFFGMNRGTEIRHEQTLDLTYRPKWLSILNPDVQFKGSYTEDARPQFSQASTDPDGLKTIANAGTARTTITLPFSRFGQGVRRGAGRDTSGVNPLFVPFRFFLSRMQDVQATFNFQRGSSLTRVKGTPGGTFKLGFTEVFDPDIERLDNSLFQTQRSYVTNASTQFRPIQTLTFDFRADHRLSFNDALYGARRGETLSWPDVKGRWSDLQRLLGMNQSMSSLALSSGYALRTEELGPKDGLVEQRTRTTSLAPLLGWEAAFRNGIRMNVSTSNTITEATDDRVPGVARENQTTNSSVQVNKVFPAAKGIKLPGSKKRIKLPNDLNLGATLSIGSNRQLVRQANGREYLEIYRSDLSVGSKTVYNFSQSIAGGFDLAFRQNKDKKLDVTTRGITIAFNGTFRF